MAEVRIPTVLRPLTDNASAVQSDADTIGKVFDDLVTRFPGIAAQLSAEDGGIPKSVNVYVNDEDIRYLDKLDTRVEAADVIMILPAVSGG